jgi:hypothetical protein
MIRKRTLLFVKVKRSKAKVIESPELQHMLLDRDQIVRFRIIQLGALDHLDERKRK